MSNNDSGVACGALVMCSCLGDAARIAWRHEKAPGWEPGATTPQLPCSRLSHHASLF